MALGRYGYGPEKAKYIRLAWSVLFNGRPPESGPIRNFKTSCSSTSKYSGSGTVPKGDTSSFNPSLLNLKLFGSSPEMSYFVIGVSGVTCGGKTSLTKLLQRSFPWATLVHQDHYFYDDDWPQHIRVPEVEDHVNYEILNALDMDKMHKDVQTTLEGPPKFEQNENSTKVESGDSKLGDRDDSMLGDKAEIPNFDEKFLQEIPNINLDTSRFNHVPILIIEGFTIFGSQFLFDKCDVRFFCSLDKETCRKRRSVRTYIPPDSSSYFDKIIWPEYEKHFENYINKRTGLKVFDGNCPIDSLWKTSVQITTCRMEEKLGDAGKINSVLP